MVRKSPSGTQSIISPEYLLDAYRSGFFPMADAQDDPDIYWVTPEWRGIFPLDTFHVPRRLARTIKSTRYQFKVDTAFDKVLSACAAPNQGRPNTWINGLISRSYRNLFNLGHAHSIEVWSENLLVGGLYGVRIGGAFFGESMFSALPNTSKMALVHLVARLRAGQFKLLDAQFLTDHLRTMGAVSITQSEYIEKLKPAIRSQADFYVLGGAGAAVDPGAVLQLTTQMS